MININGVFSIHQLQQWIGHKRNNGPQYSIHHQVCISSFLFLMVFVHHRVGIIESAQPLVELGHVMEVVGVRLFSFPSSRSSPLVPALPF